MAQTYSHGALSKGIFSGSYFNDFDRSQGRILDLSDIAMKGHCYCCYLSI